MASRDISHFDIAIRNENTRHRSRISDLEELREQMDLLLRSAREYGVAACTHRQVERMGNEGLDCIGTLKAYVENTLKRPFVYILNDGYRSNRLEVPDTKWCEGLVSQFHIIAKPCEPARGKAIPHMPRGAYIEDNGVFDFSPHVKGRLCFYFRGNAATEMLEQWLTATRTEIRYKILLKTN